MFTYRLHLLRVSLVLTGSRVDGTGGLLLCTLYFRKKERLPVCVTFEEASEHGRVSASLLRALLHFVTRLISDKWYHVEVCLFFSLFGHAFSSSDYTIKL